MRPDKSLVSPRFVCLYATLHSRPTNGTDDFQVSSKELEDELERELESTEEAKRELEGRIEQLERIVEEWKVRSMDDMTGEVMADAGVRLCRTSTRHCKSCTTRLPKACR
jgi:hypothetical protein